jgi:hypothetical protein
MSVYVLGTANNGALPDYHRSVLQSKLTAIWNAADLQFHEDESSAFTPEKCAGVLIAGAQLPANFPDFQYVSRYITAMHWFSGSSAGIGLMAPEEFGAENWDRYISALKRLNLITVADSESAQILRNAGLASGVFTCADFAYLTPLAPLFRPDDRKRPVLGVMADGNNEIVAVTGELSRDFEVRYISAADFSDIDICLTTQHHGVVLSVLHEIPFAVMDHGGILARDCNAIGYPLISDVRNAWSERVALRELVHLRKRDRVRFAQRNFDLLQATLSGVSVKTTVPGESGRQTLLVWAASDDYWDETQDLRASIGPGFDCLMPASSRLSPRSCRKRLSLPRGTLMHWAMLPEELKRVIENRYENVVVCHAFAADEKTHLADIATRTGRQRWEFQLWTHSCESYS